MALDRLTPEIRAELGLRSTAKGVYVARSPGSRAGESGVHRGDVIVRSETKQ